VTKHHLLIITYIMSVPIGIPTVCPIEMCYCENPHVLKQNECSNYPKPNKYAWTIEKYSNRFYHSSIF